MERASSDTLTECSRLESMCLLSGARIGKAQNYKKLFLGGWRNDPSEGILYSVYGMV